jgi:flavin reductase (DIM6/NTAB) family NADH-FMN oxidoreductase RutF/rubredoxin
MNLSVIPKWNTNFIRMKFKAFHKLSYGLYIIASESEGEKAGYIGNTAFQVTSTPAQIAISCHKNNATAAVISASNIFSVSVLKKDSETSLIGEFGFMTSTDIDKFRNVKTMTAKTGAPVVLTSVVAWFDCKVVNTVDMGSHILFVGEVVDSDVVSGDEPLTYDYYREKYRMLAPKNAPTFVEKEVLENEVVPGPEMKNEPTPAVSLNKNTDIYTCSICGFQYNPAEGDPALGIPPGTSFDDLPDDYKCPICNAGKEYFNPVE